MMCLIPVGVTCLNSLCVVCWRRRLDEYVNTCRNADVVLHADLSQLHSVFAHEKRHLTTTVFTQTASRTSANCLLLPVGSQTSAFLDVSEVQSVR